VEKRYVRAAALLAGGFMLASLILCLFGDGQFSLARTVVSLCAKGSATFVTALLVGIPFKIYRSRKMETA
jgi:hypothetical protein